MIADGRPTILIVDDAPENLRILGRILKDLGRIIAATSGAEALAAAKATPPDIVLLDIVMPDMDGYDVCRALKQDAGGHDIPVIFVTAKIDDADEAKGLEIGAIDYVAKPVVPPILRARVRNHLALRRATAELRRANAELLRLATTDPLTGVSNRRHFFALGDRETTRARRYKHRTSVIMLDIDHFKRINDTHGHDIGDKAIIAVAQAARAMLRTEDVFGRMGGEEFATLLPETDAEKARLAAERLRLLIGEIVVATPTGPLSFTASLGVAELRDETETCEDALKRADAALYAAKQAGRNRVAVA